MEDLDRMLNSVAASDVQRLSAEEAARRASIDCTVFVDVRKPEYYEKLRIAGAVSVPLKGPADRYWELPRDCDVILY